MTMTLDKALLIGPFKQVLTMDGLSLKGPLHDEALPILRNDFWILIIDEKISEIGKYKDLVNKSEELDLEIHHLIGSYVCLPGLVDCHTHICFGGSRAKDYAMRNSGKSYLDIAKSGGGIWDTVSQTRKESANALEKGIIKRAQRHFTEGVTTIEVKSGYGLSIDQELKMLEAIAKADENCQSDLISTCLAAHILPKDFEGDHQDYLNHICDRLLPKIKESNLSNRVDIFVEEGAFSAGISKIYLQHAKSMGFSTTVHADQFHTGGSELAVEVGAISADHLEASGNNEIDRLANSDVIPVALPGASLGLGMAFTPARKLLDAGASLAIATDWNPGSAPMGDLVCQASILGAHQKLTNAEVLAGITYRAASALELKNIGRIAKDCLADMVIFPVDHYDEIFYNQGKIKPEIIIKRGNLFFN